MEMSKFSVGHDLANLKTRNWKEKYGSEKTAIMFTECAYQTKWAQNGQTGQVDRRETELKERQNYNNEVKYVPAFSKVKLWT